MIVSRARVILHADYVVLPPHNHIKMSLYQSKRLFRAVGSRGFAGSPIPVFALILSPQNGSARPINGRTRREADTRKAGVIYFAWLKYSGGC